MQCLLRPSYRKKNWSMNIIQADEGKQLLLKPSNKNVLRIFYCDFGSYCINMNKFRIDILDDL